MDSVNFVIESFDSSSRDRFPFGAIHLVSTLTGTYPKCLSISLRTKSSLYSTFAGRVTDIPRKTDKCLHRPLEEGRKTLRSILTHLFPTSFVHILIIDRMLQEQSTRMAKWRVSPRPTASAPAHHVVLSETNLDDVLQISNVFINVSKGELAKSNDLQKAFGTSSVDEAVKEVGRQPLPSYLYVLISLSDPEKGRGSSRRERTRT